MAIAGEGVAAEEPAFKAWRQGDATLDADLEFAHLADLSKPATKQSADTAAGLGPDIPAAPAMVSDAVPGLVVLSQTCDIVRDADKRPYVEVAPLVAAEDGELEQIRKMKYPNRAYVPGLANHRLVADLDRTMTVEKPVLSSWTRVEGCRDRDEIVAFQEALRRKRGRFAFPDDFEKAVQKLQKRMSDRAGKQSREGIYVDALKEIRVRAEPHWEAQNVTLEFWFVKDSDPPSEKEGGVAGDEWPKWKGEWENLVDTGGRFTSVNCTVARHDGMMARDILDTERLDLDRLSMEE